MKLRQLSERIVWLWVLHTCPLPFASAFAGPAAGATAGDGGDGGGALGGLAETLLGRELGGAAYSRDALGELLAAQVRRCAFVGF